MNKDSLCIVIKIGTSSLVDSTTGIKLGTVATLAEVVASLKRQNHNVLLVTSGAVGIGALTLGITGRPTLIHERQALAAIGQVRLMRELNSMLHTLGLESAQVLLNKGNFHDSEECANALQTIKQLFAFDVVPIVNENDVVSTPTAKFEDNDQLSALVSRLIGADMMFLLTDVNGLYTANPSIDVNAQRIEVVDDLATLRHQVQIDDGPGSRFSTGGMGSKLEAVQLAVSAGVRAVIMSAPGLQMIPPFVERTRTDGNHVTVPSFGTVFVEESNNNNNEIPC
jgi:glutamate 5-kinase